MDERKVNLYKYMLNAGMITEVDIPDEYYEAVTGKPLSEKPTA